MRYLKNKSIKVVALQILFRDGNFVLYWLLLRQSQLLGMELSISRILRNMVKKFKEGGDGGGGVFLTYAANGIQ